jgi:hypothetical protein
LCIVIAFVFQWIAFIPAYINRTEKFYDLTGGTTFIAVVATAILLTPNIDARSRKAMGNTCPCLRVKHRTINKSRSKTTGVSDRQLFFVKQILSVCRPD